MNEGNFNLFDFDYSQVEEQKNFTVAKPGVYTLKAEDIQVGTREELEEVAGDTRIIAKIRYSFANPEGVEKLEDGILGGVFNRLWLHTPKALGFLRALVEAHGVTWAEFTAAIKTQAGRDQATVMQELLGQFVGTTAEARLSLITKDQHGNDLNRPRNEIAGYVVSKTARA